MSKMAELSREIDNQYDGSEGRMLEYYSRKADDLYLEKILHKLKPLRGSLAYKDLSKKECA